MMNIEVSGAESEISLSPFLKIKNLLAVIGQNRELFDDHYASMIASLDELEKENISLRERNVDLTALQVFSAHDPLQIPSLPVSNVAPAVALDNHAYEKDRLNFIMLSLRKLGILTERSREGFFLADVDGRIFEWNHSEEQITGLPRDVVLGTFIWDIDMELWGGKNSEKPEEKLTSEQKKATYMDLVQTGLSPVFERIFEIETQRPDGTRRSVQISFFPIQTEKGFVMGGITRDVTELKRALQALEDSTQELASQKQFIARIIESIPSSLVVINRSMQVVSVNHNFLEKMRREESATLGHKMDIVFPEALLKYMHLSQMVQAVFQSGRKVDGGKVAYHAPGFSNKIFYFRLFPIFRSPRPSGGNAGLLERVENVMLLIDDVTEREQLRENVRRIERHLAGVVESANDLVVSLDPGGKIVTWNRAAEVVSGLASDQIIGRMLVSVCSPDQQPAMESMLGKLLQSGNVQHAEIDLLTSDAKQVPISWSCSLMRDDLGQISAIVAIGRDLTERRQMEEQLSRSADMASLGVMAGGIAHELRNPLGIISASAQLMMENPRDTRLRRQGLNKIYASTRRASLIIENLLKFSRPAGKWMKKEINLRLIIDETLALLENQISSQHVDVLVTCPETLPRLAGSHEMLQQVFTNLILNACNAMPAGGLLTIAVAVNENGQVGISFKDTGHGISPENLEKIFDPFFTTMPVGEGVGLGLSVTHSIVQQHNGSIEVKSEVGKGSNFTVLLPRVFEVRN